ncbi:MAG: hypothetical protein IPL84_13920 [Chitinophagaceae bacterium]|nr:hypothetical protein [Chitinophagaceae bacterium]
MKVVNGSNFGSVNMHNYQVIISTELKGEELREQDLDDIEEKFNGPSGEIILRLFYLTRKIELISNKGHLSGYVLYMSQDNFSEVDWELIANDVKSVVDQIDAVLSPYK